MSYKEFSEANPKAIPQFHERQLVRIEWQKRAIYFLTWPCCLNCDSWSGSRGICLEAEAAPPASVIVVGCNHWIEAVPF